MAEAVAGLLASAFVGIAKDKLTSAIADQANLLWNFSDDLEDMKEVLETISAALEDAERRAIQDKLVRLWLKRLKDVALDISDMLEDYQDTTDEATTSTKNPWTLPCLVPMANKTIMANRMKSVREKLCKINMEFKNFEFIVTQGTRTTIVEHYDKRETTSTFLPEVKGRHREKQEIIKLLYRSTNDDESQTTILPIFGLAGMGKSTLAQLVYNDHQFKNYDHRVWVYVSQDFNLLQIGTSIISQLEIGGQQNGDHRYKPLQVINKCLDKLLHHKKVLIVLDDFWEEDDTELTKLKSMLLVGMKASMIDVIVTTREEKIARKVATSEPYKLQQLSDDICWEIIKRSSKCNKEEFESIGMDIAKKCAGVPLAAQTLGFMLQSKDLSEWRKINDSDIWNEKSKDTVVPSLKLSYQRMPHLLRICFSYCAIFTKGHNIAEDDLIHQWSALGFIETSMGKEYIKQLLGMSFLQVSMIPSTSQEHVARYIVHDLVHDLARLTMADELVFFDVAPRRIASAHKYCRYSLLRKYEQTMKLTNMPSKTRALRFSDSGELDISSGAFSFAKCLRTLDFSECSGILLPPSIGQLKQLRCLIAPRMKNGSLPECITSLPKLQFLNINGSSKIMKLPESIGNLGCLEYLCLSGCSGISKLPESFGELKCMVHLDMSGCSGLIELPDSLGNLGHLQHLELSGCSSVKAVPESLCGLTQLKYLNLSSCACLERLPEGIGSLVGIQSLNLSGCEQIKKLPQSLTNLKSLLQLNLSGCWRMWGGSLACLRGLTALQHLDLSRLWYCYNNDLFDDFIAMLTNLEYLDLSYSYELAYVPNSIGNLKRLHTLDLSYCCNLNFLPESMRTLGLKSLLLDGCSDAVLDQASSLVNYSQTLPVFKVRADGGVNGCSNLHLLEGVHVSEFKIRCLENVRSLEEARKVRLSDNHNLSKLTLSWSTKRAVQILEDQDLLGELVPPTGLKSICLRGYNCTGFPSWLMSIYRHLTNLVSIQLWDLSMCSNLPPLGQLPQLKKLSLRKLPGIKRINEEFCGGRGAFSQLSYFSISWMVGLEEWNTTYYDAEAGVEELMFPKLERLEILGCPRLSLKPCPPRFHECYINGSGQVISSLEKVDRNRTSLRHCTSSSPAIKLDLDMAGAMKLDLDMMGDSWQSMRLFRYFLDLRELRICGLPLKSLPESMCHLTSLESLTLQCCYCISALPEWLGDLSSLKTLVISACHGIKSLPASTQQLTKLQTLEISYCPKLQKWCESEENRTKLAHISIVPSVQATACHHWYFPLC